MSEFCYVVQVSMVVVIMHLRVARTVMAFHALRVVCLGGVVSVFAYFSVNYLGSSLFLN